MKCKKEMCEKNSTEISFTSAYNMVPDSLTLQMAMQTEDVLLMWRLSRMITTSQLVDAPRVLEAGLPGFSSFRADLHPHRQARIIGYLPLIPSSPTDPTVLKEMMI